MEVVCLDSGTRVLPPDYLAMISGDRLVVSEPTSPSISQDVRSSAVNYSGVATGVLRTVLCVSTLIFATGSGGSEERPTHCNSSLKNTEYRLCDPCLAYTRPDFPTFLLGAGKAASVHGNKIEVLSASESKTVTPNNPVAFGEAAILREAYVLLEALDGYAALSYLKDRLRFAHSELERVLNSNDVFRRSLISGPGGQPVYILESRFGLFKDMWAAFKYYNAKKVL